MASSGPSGTPSLPVAPSEVPEDSVLGEATPVPEPASFPPYPPYALNPAPPCVADTIFAGRDIRYKHKSSVRPPVRPAPKPARPRGPKATDIKMTRKQMRAHARCLRRHGAVLTDRLEYMSKPQRRKIIYLWREHQDMLPADTINRLRQLLDADEPFKPDQAYEYFVNLKKTKRVKQQLKVNQIKKDAKALALCSDKRFAWARNATVAFARGIQQRLARPGKYALADGMLRLSNIIMADMCNYMRIRPPNRRCIHPKAKFIMEMSDKVAVWIDEILSESDDRMLMMDFDEDEAAAVRRALARHNLGARHLGGALDEPFCCTFCCTLCCTFCCTLCCTFRCIFCRAYPREHAGNHAQDFEEQLEGIDVLIAADDDEFADDFLNMMAGGSLLRGSLPAYMKFKGEMLEAFNILTEAMQKKGDQTLLDYEKFSQTFGDGADELKRATDFDATEYNTAIAAKLKTDLADTARLDTPKNIEPYMKDMVEICSNYLAQHAEHSKDKGPAFKLLIKQMKAKGGAPLYRKETASRTFGQAATDLDQAKGLDSDHDDPNLSQEIHSALSKTVENVTPDNLKTDMKETVDQCSKYLSQAAVDQIERGPAFDLLIQELEKHGGDSFTPEHQCIGSKYAAAYVLKSAPGLSSVKPDPATEPKFNKELHRAIDAVTPKNLVSGMNGVVNRCAGYLSAFVRDRDRALQTLIKIMKSKPTTEFAKRDNYALDYGTGAMEVETAPTIIPFLPIKDISDEGQKKLQADVESATPPDLAIAMKRAVQDVSKHLSQAVALRSGVAGPRYNLNFLGAAMNSLGKRVLFKHKAYGQSYGDAAEVLKNSGPLEHDPKAVELEHKITTEITHGGMPLRIAPTINKTLEATIDGASKHLAKQGYEKGAALDHLVKEMKGKGDAPLGHMQGYMQTHADAARRIENASSLANDKVDKGTYEVVKGKATQLTTERPPPAELVKVMPGVVDEAFKFLARPMPETAEEKRRVLADLMARKEDAIIGQDKLYKLTYTEGGEEVMTGPVGVTKPESETSKKDIGDKMNNVIPDKKLTDVLKETVNEGSTHVSDLIKGRGDAMQAIHDNLMKEPGKEFLNVGKFNATHSGVALMLDKAPKFGGQEPSPVILDAVKGRLDALNKAGATELAEQHMNDTVGIAAKYVAGVATNECGLDPKALAALAASGSLGGPSPGETNDAYRARLAAEAGGKEGAGAIVRRPGESEEEYQTRLAAVPAAGGAGVAGGTGAPGGAGAIVRRPGETEEEYQKRLAATEGGGRMSAEESARKAAGEGIYARHPGETGEQYNKRMATEAAARKAVEEEAKRTAASNVRLSGETDQEYKRRMSAEAAARKAGQGTEGRRPGESEEEHRMKLAATTAAAGASGAGADRRGTRLPGETDEEYRRRMSAEEAARKAAATTARMPGETDEEYQRRVSRLRGARGAADDHDRDGALKILHTQLKAKGNETLYKQPHTEVTHAQASQWLMHPLSKVDNKVKESGDTDRLAKKFERKLSNLVAKVTPPTMYDAMQDVIIESARILSEYFVSNNYKALATVNLIAGLQERGNEILVELDGTTETAFFAAQRLKKADKLEAREPCDQVSYYLTKKMEELVRCKTMPRKVTPTMKEHIKDAANYLSEHVTKPDEQITAYVALLEEMEANGNSSLIEGNITKSYKDAAAYLRQLTSFEDEIKRSNSSMQSSIENKLKNIMANVELVGYTKSILDGVIKNSAGLLTSYMNLLSEKTEAIACLVEKMEEGGPNILLRHGNVRKNYEDGADKLRGKNADQLLSVKSADPVVSRKIQIKLDNLMTDNTPQKFHNIIDAVIEEATRYLAVHLLNTRVIKVCKCMKNVFVQCELWCDEILRHVARPSCTCWRHGAGAAAAGSQRDRSRACPSRTMFETKDCPAGAGGTCPAPQPHYGCGHSFTYFTYPSLGTSGWHSPPQRQSPTRRSSPSLPRMSSPSSRRESSPSSVRRSDLRATRDTPQRRFSSPTSAPLRLEKESDGSSFHTPDSATGSIENVKDAPFWQTRTTMFARLPRPSERASRVAAGVAARHVSVSGQSMRLSTRPSTRRNSPVSRTKSGYSTPIVSTDQMCDWHAMMVSLMWNVQAWRDWIQENIDRALAHGCDPTPAPAPDETDENWICFQRRVTTEALQWRQYNIFSRQLTLRLSLRYRDTLIVSPTRATDRTQTYLECQQEMLEIIDMFNRWTQWLTAVVKETDTLQNNSNSSLPLHKMRWLHFKSKVQEYADDWSKYNIHLKMCWESKYKSLISDWLPGWRQPGPVWVVSACGAVPSGAIAAGVHENELIWVARTTHKCHVLPAALHPSKHCCIVYADGGVHQYTKYQVMCNAEASWVAWRAGVVGARAVRVARGVHVGRVHYRSGHLIGAVHAPHYRCHVVIFGRPFAFNCYELLVLEGDDD